jgi:hypothetical protein
MPMHRARYREISVMRAWWSMPREGNKHERGRRVQCKEDRAGAVGRDSLGT